MSAPSPLIEQSEPGFRHEALLYAGESEFVEGTSSFIRGGLEAGEPVLVVVGSAKIELLRSALDGHAEEVHFADTAKVGSNPARIIPAWRAFVSDHLREDRPVRGIGEPIDPERNAAELVECQRHESLLNLAFADSAPWRLLCPYDTDTLDPAVVDEARRSHPFIVHGHAHTTSLSYRGLESVAGPFADPLPEPNRQVCELDLRKTPLADLRRFVFDQGRRAGLRVSRSSDLVLAVHEVAANSLRHSGSAGIFRMWQEGEALICEVCDGGQIDDPLVGREAPTSDQVGGRGLWMVNRLCDLAQIRSFRDGSAVRLHMRLPHSQAA
jgi:anti-sigma regulatory factor (Ser/Thr protein kinase)